MINLGLSFLIITPCWHCWCSHSVEGQLSDVLSVSWRTSLLVFKHLQLIINSRISPVLYCNCCSPQICHFHPYYSVLGFFIQTNDMSPKALLIWVHIILLILDSWLYSNYRINNLVVTGKPDIYINKYIFMHLPLFLLLYVTTFLCRG